MKQSHKERWAPNTDDQLRQFAQSYGLLARQNDKMMRECQSMADSARKELARRKKATAQPVAERPG